MASMEKRLFNCNMAIIDIISINELIDLTLSKFIDINMPI
jgi:hypothetical protein